jgi:hypothetical protein
MGEMTTRNRCGSPTVASRIFSVKNSAFFTVA